MMMMMMIMSNIGNINAAYRIKSAAHLLPAC
jgi:hypothetical protein